MYTPQQLSLLCDPKIKKPLHVVEENNKTFLIDESKTVKYPIVDGIIMFFWHLTGGDFSLAFKGIMLSISSFFKAYITAFVAFILLCSWIWEENQDFNIFKNEIGLNLQRIQNSFLD